MLPSTCVSLFFFLLRSVFLFVCVLDCLYLDYWWKLTRPAGFKEYFVAFSAQYGTSCYGHFSFARKCAHLCFTFSIAKNNKIGGFFLRRIHFRYGKNLALFAFLSFQTIVSTSDHFCREKWKSVEMRRINSVKDDGLFPIGFFFGSGDLS